MVTRFNSASSINEIACYYNKQIHQEEYSWYCRKAETQGDSWGLANALLKREVNRLLQVIDLPYTHILGFAVRWILEYGIFNRRLGGYTLDKVMEAVSIGDNMRSLY